MALPKIKSVIYSTEVPSTKAKVKYRPFTVAEQKALLIAQQSEDLEVMIDTLKQVISNCVLDPIDVDSLAIFDLEYLFIQIRCKSVGEVVELMFMCDVCDESTKMTFDLRPLKVVMPEGHEKKIDLGDNLGMIMKYPTINTMKKLDAFDENDAVAVFDIVSECVDQIYDAEQVYSAKDCTKDELDEFINSLSSAQFSLVKKFFQTMPKLLQQVIWDCPKCGHHHDKVLKGINNFF